MDGSADLGVVRDRSIDVADGFLEPPPLAVVACDATLDLRPDIQVIDVLGVSEGLHQERFVLELLALVCLQSPQRRSVRIGARDLDGSFDVSKCSGSFVVGLPKVAPPADQRQ